MSDLWGWLLLVGQLLFPLAGLGLVVFLLLRFTRPRPRSHAPEAGPPTPPESRAVRASAVAIAVSGLGLPWLVGLAVKVWLDAHGEPTYPVASFLEPTAVVILLAATVAQWCWPFLLLVVWLRGRFGRWLAPGRPERARLLVAWTTHAGGLVGGVFLFARVFREWDVMYVFVPLGAFLIPPLAAGYGLGRLWLSWREGARSPA